MNCGCSIDEFGFFLRTLQGGTSKLECHTKVHTSDTPCNYSALNLPRAGNTKITESVKLAVAIDIQMEIFLGCLALSLNNVMKNITVFCNNNNYLHLVGAQCCGMKKIAADMNRAI